METTVQEDVIKLIDSTISLLKDDEQGKEISPKELEDTMNLTRSVYMIVHNTNKKKKPPYVLFDGDLNSFVTNSGNLNSFEKRMFEQSTIILVIGRRGSGKTALGMKLLEGFDRNSNRVCYAIGYNKAKLPMWINKAESILDIPSNSVVLIDEGAVVFSSRESGQKANKAISKIMAIARHKNLSLILITQNSAMIDVNVLRLADTMIVKKPSLMQLDYERGPMKKKLDKAAPYLEKLEGIDQKKGMYIFDDEFEGFVKAGLPEFWTDEISKSFEEM